jgi:hypothetical protein
MPDKPRPAHHSEPVPASEFRGLIEQGIALKVEGEVTDKALDDYLDYLATRRPVDAPRVLPLHPRRVAEMLLGLLFAASVFALSVYGIAVALGKAGS